MRERERERERGGGRKGAGGCEGGRGYVEGIREGVYHTMLASYQYYSDSILEKKIASY